MVRRIAAGAPLRETLETLAAAVAAQTGGRCSILVDTGRLRLSAGATEEPREPTLRAPIPGGHGDAVGEVTLCYPAAPSQHPGPYRTLVETAADLAAIAVGRHLDRQERGASTAAAREATRRLATLLDASPLGIHEIDRDGCVRIWSRATEEMLGWPAAEVLGKPFPAVPPGHEGEYEEARARVFAGDMLLGLKRTRRHRDGSDVAVQLSLAPVRNDRGEVVSVLGVYSDITQREQLEEQLRQTQKLEAIGQLAGGVAHDFNNILTAILGYTDLLLARERDKQDEADLTEVRRAGERAAALVQQLLAFSRRRNLTPSRLDVNSIVRQVTPMLQRLLGHGVTLETRLGEDVPLVEADAGQIEQVVMNLVVNGRDALPDGGEIVVATDEALLGRLAAGKAQHAVPPGRYARITVRDHGVGMDRATLERCREPFFTTRAPGYGTGLGLSTVSGIVGSAGGCVDIDSAPGAGTTVRVYLPTAADLPTAPAPAVTGTSRVPAPLGPRRGQPTAIGATILVVEDAVGVREVAREVLEQQGYRVIEAGDGREAQEIARRHGGAIDLLLTDVEMPHVQGPALTGILRSLHPQLAVVYMSGSSDLQLPAAALGGGPSLFLSKPFGLQQLLQTVHEALSRHTAARS